MRRKLGQEAAKEDQWVRRLRKSGASKGSDVVDEKEARIGGSQGLYVCQTTAQVRKRESRSRKG